MTESKTLHNRYIAAIDTTEDVNVLHRLLTGSKTKDLSQLDRKNIEYLIKSKINCINNEMSLEYLIDFSYINIPSNHSNAEIYYLFNIECDSKIYNIVGSRDIEEILKEMKENNGRKDDRS